MIEWEFIADELNTKVGKAIFAIGGKSIVLQVDSFAHAHKISVLMNEAYMTGRATGIAEVKSLVRNFS